MQASSPPIGAKHPQLLPPRIVCLVPSITELLFAMGLGPWVVGRTGYCIHPREGVASVPKVGGTKSVNLPKIKRIAPTHVIVNVDENTLDCVTKLREFVPHVVVTHPQTPRGNLALIDQMLGEFATDDYSKIVASNPMNALTKALKDRINEEIEAFEAATPTLRRVLYLIWRDPWMCVAQDTYISRMLALGGLQTWPEVSGGISGAARYPVVDLMDEAQAGVDAVLLSSEPYAFDASHVAELQAMLPSAKCLLVDGEAISWYGPRCLAGFAQVRALADALDRGLDRTPNSCATASSRCSR